MLKSFTFVYVRLLNKEGLSSAFPYCGQFRRACAHASFILRPLLIWQFKIRNDLADMFCFFLCALFSKFHKDNNRLEHAAIFLGSQSS